MLTSFVCSAQLEHVENYIQTFPANSSTTVDISNKYGKVHILTWKEDSVKFEVVKIVRSKTPELLDKLVSTVNIDFTQTSLYLHAATTVGNKQPNFLEDLKSIAESISNDRYIEINYTVYIPDYINLSIDNKYGDIYLPDLRGNLNLKLSNGNLKGNNLMGSNDITIKFGDAVFNNINTSRVTLYYAEIMISESANLTIDSKSSKITVDKTNMLKLSSKRDKLYLKQVNNLFGNSSFSDFWITQLNSEASCNVKYGNMNLDNIPKAFSYINLTTKYTDLNLYFEKGSAYALDIIYEGTDIIFPVNISVIEKKPVPGEDKKQMMTGKVGTPSGNAKVNINAEDGNINIIHK